MKIFFFFPMCSPTAGGKEKVNLTCDNMFMFNNCHRQGESCSIFLSPLASFVVSQKNGPWELKVMSCDSMSASLPSVGTSLLERRQC